MNHQGELPSVFVPFPEFRSTFPVRYFFINFGCSRRFPSGSDPSAHMVPPFKLTREHRAPELDGTRLFNPFAADVYQMARFLFAWIPVSKLIPLPLLSNADVYPTGGLFRNSWAA